MATGKSHVGRIIARTTGRRMTDLDEEIIVRRAGKPIHRIFSEDGEIVFRAMERHAALTLCEGGDKVIAAGGRRLRPGTHPPGFAGKRRRVLPDGPARNHPPSHHPGQPQRRRAAHAWRRRPAGTHPRAAGRARRRPTLRPITSWPPTTAHRRRWPTKCCKIYEKVVADIAPAN